MTTANVRLQTLRGAVDVSGIIPVNGKVEKEVGASFGDILKGAASDQSKASLQSSLKPSTESKKLTDQVNNLNQDDKSKAVNNPRAKDGSDSKNAEKSADVTDKDTKSVLDDGAPVNNIPDDVRDTVQEAIGKIKEEIAEKLGVSEEDIENAMEVLGLTVMDLLKTENMTLLVSELSNTDLAALITDESLYTVVTELQAVQRETVADLLQKLDLTPEEFEGMLKELEAQIQTDENPAEKSQMNEEPIQKFELPKQEEPQVVVIDNREKEIPEDKQDDTKKAVERDIKENPILSKEDNDTAGTPAETVKTSSEIVRPDSQPERIIEREEEDKTVTENRFAVPEETKTGNRSDNKGFLENGFQQSTSQGTSNLFEQNLNSAVNETASETTISYADTYEQIRDIMNQIESQVKISLNAESTSMEMQLNPASLGKLALHIESKAGVITAQFMAQNAAVKTALEAQVAELRETLQSQGIKVEHVEVTLASHEFERNLMGDQHPGQNSESTDDAQRSARLRRINLNNGGEEADDLVTGEENESEALARRIMRQNGNRIDFTA